MLMQFQLGLKEGDRVGFIFLEAGVAAGETNG